MVKIENKNKFHIGDKVWYFNSWGVLCHGVIYEIKGEFAGTKEGKYGGAVAGAKLEKCWPSKEECLKAENKRALAQKAEYKESIKSVEDLVRFLYDKNINDSECPDYDAKAAAEERAAEFGIDLNQ